MTTAYDIWDDFADISTDGTIVTYADFAELTAELKLGEQLTVGDSEGNRCPATVAAVEGTRITLQLDLDRWRGAP